MTRHPHSRKAGPVRQRAPAGLASGPELGPSSDDGGPQPCRGLGHRIMAAPCPELGAQHRAVLCHRREMLLASLRKDLSDPLDGLVRYAEQRLAQGGDVQDERRPLLRILEEAAAISRAIAALSGPEEP